MEILVCSYGDRGAPHVDWIRRSNPGCRIHVETGGVRGLPAGLQAWRNADRLIRDWWRANGHLVEGDRLAIAEWDVLVMQDFETAGAPAGAGLAGRHPKIWGADHQWHWWRESGRLPAVLRPYRHGLAPLGILIATRACLDAVADSRWDHVFSLDIFCELRLPTVVRACGFEVGRAPSFDGCGWHPITRTTFGPGFWHPVKHEITT